MKKYGIFYGSLTGTTRDVAHRIADALGPDKCDLFDVHDAEPAKLADYERRLRPLDPTHPLIF